MTEQNDTTLHERLKNCIQTILELEPDVERLELGHILRDEYSTLRDFLERVDSVHLEEGEVRRIEEATSSFLEELESPLGNARDPRPRGRIMQ
ncbi:hypothetical protein [Oceanidesulfovibrio marinus]|uniref:Uncharacterized protein n=1 Tax=Oceanidesulfovibrio marinus TaxID=370038 RepID=A0A6P1ZMG1_9BACT|nr:hypothetical protein [Oceanidesulfovibrio marinus]QJT08224.1 hypothetical protein E8L03_04470 [Oceanidesulfovibrio marinus]TVM35119.1 hypothetical protein DQK91_06890 [Oceanidesulfovibrio marinus]